MGIVIPGFSKAGMIAIPVLRSRVAPVLNWCSRIQIFPEDPSQEGLVQELILPHLEAAQRLQVLRYKGVRTLICGALSADLRFYARQLGLTVVCGVAGEVAEVVRSYWQNTLDHPRFWLPGCPGPRRYRRTWRGGKGLPCEGEARPRCRSRRGGRQGQTRVLDLGPGVFWVCPVCGCQVPHEPELPGTQERCPQCGWTMERA